MTARNRPALVTLVVVLALALLAAGSTAVATAAVKVAAKNSVISKSIKNNTVAGKDLKDGSVTSADVADGSLGSTDLTDGSVGSVDVADNGLTGADIAEATLGTVPNATAVGGVQVTPLSVSLPSTSVGVQVLTEQGDVVVLDCQGAALRYTLSRGPTGPPLLYTGIVSSGNATATALAANESVDIQILDGQFTVAIVRPGGGSVTLEFTGIYEANASGANDCFYRGTITRVP